MSITTISDNELRLIGEAKVLRDLLTEALAVISPLEGECATEQVMLYQLKNEIEAALTDSQLSALKDQLKAKQKVAS